MKKAFSLIELSIVLVIISIIIAGVMMARSKIETSRLNAVIAQLNNYKSAHTKFMEIYNALPGDMVDASSVLPTNPTSGNGNSIINKYMGGMGHPDNDPNSENLLYWKHIGLAGLIDEKYSGDGDLYGGYPDVKVLVPGTNLPEGPMDGSSFDVGHFDGAGYYHNSFIGTQEFNAIVLGRVFDSPNNFMIGPSPAITNEVLSIIDMKIDDGKASTGDILSAMLVGEPDYNMSNPNGPNMLIYRIDRR